MAPWCLVLRTCMLALQANSKENWQMSGLRADGMWSAISGSLTARKQESRPAMLHCTAMEHNDCIWHAAATMSMTPTLRLYLGSLHSSAIACTVLSMCCRPAWAALCQCCV
jgi:hypothetical protein